MTFLKEPIALFQTGLPLTWATPNNSIFNQSLCRPGTTARDNWSEKGFIIKIVIMAAWFTTF